MERLTNEEIELIEDNDIEVTEMNHSMRKESINARGLFVRVPQGYEIVAEGIDGKLRTKAAGLRFFYPWDKKYVFYVNDTPIDFRKEKYKSKEGFEISVDAAVTYHIVDAQKFHTQKNGLKQLKLVVGEILRTYSSEHNFEDVNVWTLNIDLEEINGRIAGTNKQIMVDYPEFVAKLLTLYLDYGLSVSNIIVQKAELSDDLKKSKEEDSLTEAKNKRMLATANAELMAAKIKADAEKVRGEAEATNIEKKIQYIAQQIGGANTPEQLSLIKAILIGENANYTVIQNETGDATYAKYAFLNQNANTLSNTVVENNENLNQDEEKGISKIKK